LTARLAAEVWQRGVFRRINLRMRLLDEEFGEEMDFLRSSVDEVRGLKRRLLTERHD